MSNTSSWRGSGNAWGSSFPTSRGFSNRGSWRTEEEKDPSPPKGDLLIEIKREELPQSKHSSKITDCRYVASYNWLEEPTPTVIIPGRPPAWTPPSSDRRLDPDRGRYYRDPNAARYPDYPMEAAIQAVLKQNPQFPTRDIDLVTCSSSLGNLSRFARGVEKEFRIILAKVGTTVFLVRRENSPTALIPNVRGYGHTFPEEYTTWEKDVKNSASHQRVVRYQFAGLHLLVRFEVDGYRPPPTDVTSNLPLPVRPEPDSSVDEASINAIADLSSTISIGHRKSAGTGQRRLEIKEGGAAVDQEWIFDLKTRSAIDFQTKTVKKEIDLSEQIPRFWASQISTLVVAYHRRGLFLSEDINFLDMREDIKRWEEANTKNLGMLASLLYQLIEIAKNSQASLEICRSGSGALEIRQLVGDYGAEALPSELREMWAREPEESKGKGRELSDSWCEPDSDGESLKDYTACSADGCGYCGYCSY